MYRAVTHDIEVAVTPEFLPNQSEPEKSRFAWAYHVEITNRSTRAVQLKSRYWRIVDGEGRVEEVRGPGVVGKEPVLGPGQTFRYTSGCPLKTPDGVMAGQYFMIGAGGDTFAVEIPAFPLHSPHVKRVLN